MSGFEFTPMGIMPLNTYSAALEKDAIAGATAFVPGPEARTPAPVAVSPKTVEAPHRAQAKPIKPVDVVKMARARLRDVDREIKRLKKLEIERDELKRLIDAATGKPLAIVRSMPTRSA